jgi:glutaredoxin-like YruB-family protein
MKKITVYSTPTCVYCVVAKRFFDKNGLEYTEHNVADDLKARQEMVDKSHQLGVPVIDIGGEIFVGFDKAGISAALGIAG